MFWLLDDHGDSSLVLGMPATLPLRWRCGTFPLCHDGEDY